MNYIVSSDDTCTSFVNTEGKETSTPVLEGSGCLIENIPQNSSLINQTSMTVDEDNAPYIVSYWRKNGIVQYQILYKYGNNWESDSLGLRKTDFVLNGGSTMRMPCARPQIVVEGAKEESVIHLLFRDDEYGEKRCFQLTILKIKK